ncbi:hypothetical protein Tco_0132123 [Tanacetum coccineum]
MHSVQVVYGSVLVTYSRTRTQRHNGLLSMPTSILKRSNEVRSSKAPTQLNFSELHDQAYENSAKIYNGETKKLHDSKIKNPPNSSILDSPSNSIEASRV